MASDIEGTLVVGAAAWPPGQDGPKITKESTDRLTSETPAPPRDVEGGKTLILDDRYKRRDDSPAAAPEPGMEALDPNDFEGKDAPTDNGIPLDRSGKGGRKDRADIAQADADKPVSYDDVSHKDQCRVGMEMTDDGYPQWKDGVELGSGERCELENRGKPAEYFEERPGDEAILEALRLKSYEMRQQRRDQDAIEAENKRRGITLPQRDALPSGEGLGKVQPFQPHDDSLLEGLVKEFGPPAEPEEPEGHGLPPSVDKSGPMKDGPFPVKPRSR